MHHIAFRTRMSEFVFCCAVSLQAKFVGELLVAIVALYSSLVDRFGVRSVILISQCLDTVDGEEYGH